MAIQKLGSTYVPPVYHQNDVVESASLPVVTDETVNDLPPIHGWKVGDAVVLLLKNGDNLEYLLIKEYSQQIQKPIPRPVIASLEEYINFLKSCEPLINQESVSFVPILHSWIWQDYEIKLLKGGLPKSDDNPSDRIPFAKAKAGQLNGKEIARHLWLNPEAVISEEMVAKVNAISLHLKQEGYELRGVKFDSNSFCRAYLKSYQMLPQKLDAIESQDAPVSFLENQIAQHYARMPAEIKARASEQTYAWGYWLAVIFPIPILAFTLKKNEDHYEIECSRFEKDVDSENLDLLKNGIVIVDLEGHYLTIQAFSDSNTRQPETSEDDLIWQFFHQKTQKTSRLSFEQLGLYYVKDREMASLGTVQWDSVFSDNLLNYFKNCEIEKIVDKEDGSLENPKFIYLKPFTLNSKMDQKTAISHEIWAVTLINTSKFQSTDLKTWHEHAGIMIEGVIDGAYYSCFTDLIEKNGGTVRLREDIDPHYIDKTITHSIHWTKLDRMLLKIDEEIEQQKQGERSVFFCIEGMDSWSAVPHSFLNASPLSHLKIIKTFESYEEMIQSTLNCDPCTFDPFIWDLDQDVDLFLEMFLWETKFWVEKEDIFQFDQKCLLKHQAVELEIQSILKESPKKKCAKRPFQSVLLKNQAKEIWIESNHPQEGYLDFQKYGLRFACEMKNGGWAEVAAPFNCLSWALRKLAFAGMDVKRDLSNWLLRKPSDAINEETKGTSNSAREECHFEFESLRAPPEVRKKALTLDCLYLDGLRTARAQSAKILPKRLKTLESLLPEKIDGYTLLWVASLHGTAGITAEVRAFLINLRKNNHKTSILVALLLACKHGRINEARTLLIYFQDMVEDLPQFIDHLIDYSTEDDIATAFLDMLIHLGIDFSKTCYYQKEDEWRNKRKELMLSKGHFNFAARIDLLYQLLKKGHKIELKEGAFEQVFLRQETLTLHKEESRPLKSTKKGGAFQADNERGYYMEQSGFTLGLSGPSKKKNDTCVIS